MKIFFSRLQGFGFRRAFEKMGIFSARKAVFIKAGLRVSSKNHDFQSSRPFVSEGLLKKMGIFPARKAVFIKAGLRVWSKIHDLFKAPGLWFQKDF